MIQCITLKCTCGGVRGLWEKKGVVMPGKIPKKDKKDEQKHVTGQAQIFMSNFHVKYYMNTKNT